MVRGGGGVGSGNPNFCVHISYSWVKISLHTGFQLNRLPESRTASFRLNPIVGGGSGLSDPNFFFFIFLLVGLK